MLNDQRDSTPEASENDALARGWPRAETGIINGQSDIWHAGARLTSATDIQAEIAAAVLCDDRGEMASRLAALGLDGDADTPPDQAIVDTHIPAVARALGQAWVDSQLSFAEVTIGAARLQSVLRNLEGGQPEAQFDADAPEVLIVVPEASQHTLGAMVAMSLFRREGALARLALGQAARSVGQMVRMHHFDMVAVSAAGPEKLDFLANLVNSVRSGLAPSPPIVVGGAILSVVPDVASRVGADFATSDPKEALELCGLTRLPDEGRPAHTKPTPRSGRQVRSGPGPS
ncbi:MAG: hypothetical protein AAFU80_12735 [Pseudomonadota bacterium]